MSSQDANKLLEEFRSLKYPTKTNNKPKKRRNESDREFIFRINGYRCRYTNRVYPKNKLSLITLYPDRLDLPKWKNLGVACTDYALMKGSMNDREFRIFLKDRKKEIRKQAYELNHEIKQRVFEEYDYKCIYCEVEYGFTPSERKLTIDHKVPVAKGGTNDVEREFKNLACACEQHNFEKGDKTAPEYFGIINRRKLRKEAK